MDSQFSLRWNNYTNLITQAFGSLLHEEDLVDVTLSCEGKKIKAHKMLLSACSPYFHDIFKDNPCQHPVIVFQNVQFADLKAIVEFIYRGEVNVLQEQFESFLSTAEMMEVKGLTDKDSESEIVETSGITRDQENVLIGPVREQRISSQSTKLVSFVHEKSGPRSPPAKRKKPNAKKSSDESSTSSQVVTVVKEEVEDISIVDERDVSFSESEVSELLAPVKPGLKPSNQESLPVPETLQDNGQVILDAGTAGGDIQEPILTEVVEDPLTEEAVDVEIDNIADDPTVEGQNITTEAPTRSITPNIKIVKPKTTSIPLKKTKTISEKKSFVEEEIPAKTEKKPSEVKCVAASPTKTNTPVSTLPVKGKVQIPKGLTVTIQPVQKVQDLFDFPTQELQAEQQEETYAALRSEDATTPVHEDPNSYSTSQDGQVFEDMSSAQISEGEPEIAEEAPRILQEEKTEPEALVEEEPKEPEFDYFGCEICKDEAKPMDFERITFLHKCPICPCACFCAHLLKEHMKVIHGWFNVQRRYTHY